MSRRALAPRPTVSFVLVVLSSIAVGVGVVGCGGGATPPADYADEVAAWRADREEGLLAEDSWLTVVGLFWLDPGTTAFGADPSNPVAFPAGSAPEHAGVFDYDGDRVTVVPGADVEITIDGTPIGRRELQDDGDDAADILRLGRLSFYVIERAGRHGIRVKDPQSPGRSGFSGLDWYPIDPAWRLVARYEPRAEAEEIQVPNVLGMTTRQFVPGDVLFTHAGEEHTLIPLVSDPADTHFFFIVRDATSGRETYGAGRYFYGDLVDDRVVLDFNKIYNMPCVFTKYATCILPPPGNRLPFAVEAGEKMYGEPH